MNHFDQRAGMVRNIVFLSGRPWRIFTRDIIGQPPYPAVQFLVSVIGAGDVLLGRKHAG